MKQLLLVLLAAVPAVHLCAQRQAENWYFGMQAGITFGGGFPTFLPGSQMAPMEGCASFSDQNGDLLFYCGGSAIWSRDHELMPNGDSLNAGGSCTQAALFAPWPGQDSLFYLFNPAGQYAANNSFCYSIVDLRLNNGYGDVVHKNTPLFGPSTEKVTAVHHANGTDVWVIGHGFGNADFYAYRITTAGIDTVPVISTVGASHAGASWNMIGSMKVSPCGDKLALALFGEGRAELFDFDNETGIVSNPVHLGDYAIDEWGLYGVEFSPNGSRLYLTQEHPALLVQYDVAAGPPEAIIASADTIFFDNSSFGTLQNAPDKRIYVSRLGNRLGRINEPDELGAACHFVDSVISLLPGTGYHGLPNFISSYFCDGSVVTDAPAIRRDHPPCTVYPNPAGDVVRIGFAGAGTVQVDLLDAVGQSILRMSSPASGDRTEVTVSLADLPSGIYFLAVGDEHARRVERLVKE
jgi:hypothetical protein